MPNVSILVLTSIADHPQAKTNNKRGKAKTAYQSPGFLSLILSKDSSQCSPMSSLSHNLSPHDRKINIRCNNPSFARISFRLAHIPLRNSQRIRQFCSAMQRQSISGIVAGVSHGFIQGIYPHEYNSVFWPEYISGCEGRVCKQTRRECFAEYGRDRRSGCKLQMNADSSAPLEYAMEARLLVSS